MKDLMEEENGKTGLTVTHGEVEIGKTYPIFGMITELSDEEPGFLRAKINHNISAKLNVTDSEKVTVLKRKAFEAGIFLSKVTAIEPQLEVECRAVIFGKSQAYNA